MNKIIVSQSYYRARSRLSRIRENPRKWIIVLSASGAGAESLAGVRITADTTLILESYPPDWMQIRALLAKCGWDGLTHES